MMTTSVNYRNKIHPQKFALWVSFASIIMMFAALTSAYIVKQASGNWLEFTLPWHFIVSTIAILGSSLALHLSLRGFRDSNFKVHRLGLVLGFGLGLIFLVFQFIGWDALFAQGIDLKGNVSGSFFYLITGLHALHVMGGVAALIVAMIHTFTLPKIVTEQRVHRYELTVQYWHFVDALWIYLLIFLIFIK